MIRISTLTVRHGLQIANQGLLQSHGQLYPSHQCHPSLTSIVIRNTSSCTMRKWKYQIQEIEQSLVQNMGRASIFVIVTEEMTWLTSAAVTGTQNVRLYSSTEGWASVGSSLEIISAIAAPITVAINSTNSTVTKPFLENEASWHSHVLAMVLPIVTTCK